MSKKRYQITRGEVAVGSPMQVARKHDTGLTDAIYDKVKLIALVDTSGSMLNKDTAEGITREAKAIGQLKDLYTRYEGNILLVEFSDQVEIRPGGDTRGMHSGTNLSLALNFLRVELKADHPNRIKIVLISDGEPNSEEDALAEARLFKKPVDVIYCGPPNDGFDGQKFLEKLAKVTGGHYQATPDVANLETQVAGFLASGEKNWYDL